jgi:hypothetical protein
MKNTRPTHTVRAPLLRVSLSLVLMATLMACQEDTQDSNSAASAPGYIQLHEAYLASSCGAGACHGGEQGIMGLSFDDPEIAYARLIHGAPKMGAAAAAGLSLVTPGETDTSYLFHKLTRTNDDLLSDDLGARMPLSLSAASDEVVAAVRSWIEAGAPYDGAEISFEQTGNGYDEDNQYVFCDAEDEAGMQGCFEPPGPSEDWMRLYTPPLTIPAGSERLWCSYIEAPTDDIRLRAATGKQMEGGHHIAIFVGLTGMPDEKMIDCTDISMGSLRFVTGAGGTGGKDLQMPEGVALTIKKGETIVIQSHYINATTEDRVVMDAIDFNLTTVEESPTNADPFSVMDSTFSVPAGAEDYQIVSECGVPEPISLHMALGHTHDFGVLFSMDVVRDGVSEQIYYATDGPKMRDDPEILFFDEPIELVPGDTIRVTCGWTNTTEHDLGWPEEMCVGLLYYSPGQGFLVCDQGEDFPEIDDGAPAGPGCVADGAEGNDLGVGKHCTPDAPQCPSPLMCLAPFDDTANYCSVIFCEDDAQCGEGATCVFDDQGSACVPLICQGD